MQLETTVNKSDTVDKYFSFCISMLSPHQQTYRQGVR